MSAPSSRSCPGYLLEHARRHDYALLTRPEVNLETDERLRLGEFGIQTRLVKPPARQGEEPSQGEQGHTMVYSVPPKQTRKERRRPRGDWSGRRRSSRWTIAATCSTGRSRCWAARANATACSPTRTSRVEHAELRRGSTGDWQIVDLGSTNGIKVNDRRVDRVPALARATRSTLGTTRFIFDIEQ